MYFRACRRVSGGCCSLGFVLGGTLTAMMVVHVMDNSQLKHEKPHISESTEKLRISESTESPQIIKPTEEIQIREKSKLKSKPLKQKINLDWSKALKSYSYKNMRNVTYTVRHKIPIKQKKVKAKHQCLVVVKNQLWFSVYGTIRVYSRKGKFMNFIKVEKKLVLRSGIDTGSGDICFATGEKGLVGLDSNGKYRSKIYKQIYDVAYDKGILDGLKDRKKKTKKVVRFTFTGNKWVEIQKISLQKQDNKSPIKYDEIEVRKNTIYTLISKKLHLYNISNVSSNIRSYNSPTGTEIEDMNLLGVDPEGVSLLLDMKQKLLRLCTEDGEWSIVSLMPLNCHRCTPKTAVIDPNDNGIWVVVRDKSFNLDEITLYKLIPEE